MKGATGLFIPSCTLLRKLVVEPRRHQRASLLICGHCNASSSLATSRPAGGPTRTPDRPVRRSLTRFPGQFRCVDHAAVSGTV